MLNKYISAAERTAFEKYMELIKKNNHIVFLGELLKQSAVLYGDDTALIFLDHSMSYRELYYRALMLSKRLQELGVHADDRVLLFCENSIEFYVGYFAILQIGAVVAPLNVFLSEHELTHIIKDARPRLMIASDHFASLLAKVPDEKPTVILQSEIDLKSEMPSMLPDITIPKKDPHAMAVLLYTSGTTGFPKGVMLSSANALINAAQALARIHFEYKARVFCVLPLFHSFAQNTCVWTSLLRGCTVIIVPKIDRRQILDALKHKPDIFLGVPALYGLLCLLKTAPLDSVHYFVSGGDALPDKIRAAFALVYNRKICNGYGMTETSPLTQI